MEGGDLKDYKDYLRSSLEEWKSLDDSEIQLDKFQSMSNHVYKATASKEVNPKVVVFRKFQSLFMGFPKEKFGFLSPEQENLIFAEMSKRGFGPKCLAVNEKYRIEEYIDAQKIDNEDLKKIEVRRWHVLAITNFNKLKVEGLNKKEPTYDTYLNSAEFFEDFADKIAKVEYTPEGLELVNEFKRIASEENKEFMKKIIPKDDLVLCHGDQNLFNILVSKENGKVTLIDYERTGISFKGDDIGCFNFFTVVDVFYPEPPNMKVHEQNYPTEEIYRDTAEYYVVFYDMDDEAVKSKAEKMIFDKSLLDEYVKEKYSKEEFEGKVNKMIRNLKISFMGYSFCVVIGSLKYYSGKLNILLYAQAAYRYFMKLKEELEKDL